MNSSGAIWYHKYSTTSEIEGPYDEYGVCGLVEEGGPGFLWAAGRDAWTRLEDVPELHDKVMRIGRRMYCGDSSNEDSSSDDSSAGPPTELEASTTSRPVQPSKKAVSAAVNTAEANRIAAEVAAFEAERAALGANAGEGEAVEAAEDMGRVDKPLTDEKIHEEENEDDFTYQGTYQWDPKSQTFLAKD